MRARKVVSSPFFYAVLCIITMLFTIVHVTNAQTTSPGTQACYNNKDGTLRVLLAGSSCKHSETPITLQSGGGSASGVQKVTYDFYLTAENSSKIIPVPVTDKPLAFLFTVTEIETTDNGIPFTPVEQANMNFDMYQTQGNTPRWVNEDNGRRTLWNYSGTQDSIDYKYDGQNIVAFINKGGGSSWLKDAPTMRYALLET